MKLNLNANKIEPKTAQEVQIMRIGGLIWQAIRDYLYQEVKVGMTLKQVEELVKEQFKKYGVIPSFNKKNDFPSVICLSPNSCVVHGSATNEVIKEGDKLTIDLGFEYQGLNIDSAFSVFFELDPKNFSEEEYASKNKDLEEYKYLNQLTIAMFYASIKDLKASDLTGSISESMESFFKKYFPSKYSFLERFSGHGIGRELHEFPRIHNFGMKRNEGVVLPANSTICIEPMVIEQGDGSWVVGKDGFGIYAKSSSAKTLHYEHLVLIKEEGVEVLTASLQEMNEIKSSYEIVTKF
ncbi:methionine aminopeptidase, type I [Candidatus Mycoplasma haematolamae str. Purdue]|uniref:Methionine aminopeptidase, type I n=1 Tax=Mycoplasma haematolamae (strain Purdue) TaxID=1212765 RepID=I7C6G5_MYCHA|nr:M24 family metallopeptidase [Candidatus Mycoplasma haematolamae]AFO52102.1 methionine aminopeptidase, type I [Candidatus Mycoplasma haematolamae str. Purdue]